MQDAKALKIRLIKRLNLGRNMALCYASREDFLSLNQRYKSSPYMTVAFDVSNHCEIFGETMHEDGTAEFKQ